MKELYRTSLFKDNFDGSLNQISALTIANSVDEANSIAGILACLHELIDNTTSSCITRIQMSFN